MFHNKSCYQSCIKINGVPILPPLITPERRKELEILKQQAVLKEEQLKHRKKLKDSLNEILNYRPLCGKSFDDSSSHVEALNIGKSSDKDEITTTNQRPNTLNLTTEIIDVSQFDENGIKMITSSESSSNETETVIKNDVLKFSTQISSSPIQSSPKPRLIRSNSYTLDTPSPILLAHLEKHGTNNRDRYYNL